MTMTRRGVLALVGGGAVLAAGAGGAWAVTRTPRSATLPWAAAGGYEDPRMRALSWALLAPNPHNRQPWLADLSEPGVVTLHVDGGRLLPETDPFARQITIGLGCFLEIMRIAAAEDGFRVDLDLFPQGEDAEWLDARPVARATFVADAAVAPDPLFAQVPDRRSNKDPYDLARPVAPETVAQVGEAVLHSRFGGTVAGADLTELRALTHEALLLEFRTPRTLKESVDLFRIGAREVDANPDGLDFQGPLFESLRLAGLFNREVALDTGSFAFRSAIDSFGAIADSAMGYVWLVTEGNARTDQLRAGADWVRLNLSATALGLSTQPMSQALQEFPEMAGHYAQIHRRLAPEGGTVQMLARVGYGEAPAPSPRWPLEAKIVDA